METVASARRRNQQCPVCGEWFNKLHQHAVREHLPWFVDPGSTSKCRSCPWKGSGVDAIEHRLNGTCNLHPPREDHLGEGPADKLWAHAMFGFLFRLCEHLRAPSFNTLLLVYEHHFPQELHNHSDPSPQDSFLRTLLATEVGFTGEESQAKRHVCCRPLPFGTLIHWRVLVGLVSLVPIDSREAIRQRVELCSSQGLVEREVGLLADCLPLVCDSHLHWDSLSLRHPRSPLQQILLDHPDAQHKDFRVFGAVAVYCWPGSFPTWEQLDALNPRRDSGGPQMVATVVPPHFHDAWSPVPA